MNKEEITKEVQKFLDRQAVKCGDKEDQELLKRIYLDDELYRVWKISLVMFIEKILEAEQQNWEKELNNELECFSNLLKIKKIKEAECQKDRIIETFKEILQAQRQEIIEMAEKKLKEKSVHLPIDIERQGGQYAQGMHSGLDLAIDLITNLKYNK